MKALGVCAGIGSQLIACKELGFEILGNIEQRGCFWTRTFETYFNAPMFKHDVKLRKEWYNVDLVVGHPAMVHFSLAASVKKGWQPIAADLLPVAAALQMHAAFSSTNARRERLVRLL